MPTPSDVLRAWAAANLAADMDRWRPLVADDFTYVHSRSNLETRAELIAAFEAGRRYTRWDVEDLAERRYPGCAILNGIAHLTAGTAEAPVNLNVRLTATLIEAGPQGWQLAALQTTRLPE